jgi:protocatechuate 3,4-dioxygenase beta subunit
VTPSQATTDAQGHAQSAFTTGPQTGSQTVTATVTGLPAVTFTVTSQTGPAAAVEVVSGSGQSAQAGTMATLPLVVRVRDASGNPIAGTVVTFATVNGGSLGSAQPTTDAQGRAQTTFTTAPQAGTQAVTATVTGLAAASFTITAQAGAPVAVEPVSGGGQSARAGTSLPQPLVVQVVDGVGNPVEGAAVSFASPDGGSLIPSQATTDAQGRAQTAFTTGSAPGPQTVTATVSGLPPLTFSATAVDACTESTFYSAGANAAGTLEASDCSPAPGYYLDYFALSTSAQGALEISLASTAFGPEASVFGPTRNVMAAGAGPRIKIILAPGSYFAGASSTSPGIGQYTVSSQATTESAASCEVVFATVGIATDQKIAVSDCQDGGNYYSDRFLIALTAGQTITISQNSTVFDSFLTLRDELGTVVASDDDSGGGDNSRITFTAPSAGTYSIQAGTFFSAAIGAYTLVIQ